MLDKRFRGKRNLFVPTKKNDVILRFNKSNKVVEEVERPVVDMKSIMHNV